MGFLFSRTPEMVSKEQALHGGSTPVLEHPQPHAVLGTPITGPWQPEQRRLIIGMGCFWGAEKLLWQLDGVDSTSVGYAGGFTPNPTYREVCTGRTGHTEVVEVVYDPARISGREIISATLEAHDPTQGYRQGNDVGTQYRSAYFVDSAEDEQLVRELLAAYEPKLAAAGFGPVTTEVAQLSDTPAGAYYLAEDYHQQYLHKNPEGYCPVHSTGVACG
ncbi:peptide-methionine (S)-S-oxide reductase MsrA [Corynebacterium sp. TAE3-ERU2]|uniref:peptide-methionine (S)-S-oxide reductase MsrA n=1 Tax=Corynebacterium sp. TAE3-ERU2 TaxID=2849497 RepID=UPI001C482230|nr:peptide-methionine (S)-S-oxide reductase MsrA [Corynebacterium sp. TAE3-ERU2]MBV7302457.1 peptide-methionine (S)-S-oxide reductase MsrA [Corynebacterium sp. TAE3-ERU2]